MPASGPLAVGLRLTVPLPERLMAPLDPLELDVFTIDTPVPTRLPLPVTEKLPPATMYTPGFIVKRPLPDTLMALYVPGLIVSELLPLTLIAEPVVPVGGAIKPAKGSASDTPV